MSYAIIAVGGKQYRVREGETLLVDRLAADEGTSFEPTVLLVGGSDGPTLAPTDLVVSAKILGARKGPKLLIGKYKKRTGYKRHTGFRASLTQIEIESIGVGGRPSEKRVPVKREPSATPPAPARREPSASASTQARSTSPPEGYEEMTVADVKDSVASWEPAAVVAALAFEQRHQQRKGAIAALESAIREEDD